MAVETTPERQASSSPAAATPGAKVRVGIMPLFSTWVYLCQDGPTHLNAALEELTCELRREPRNNATRSNQGGWHYAFDFFKLKEPVVEEFRQQMELHVQTFLNHHRPPERKKKDEFQLQGWINVNRPGHHNDLHCHPGCFVSGTYYVKVPPEMKGGEIVFRDPRGPAVAMYETPEIQLPWVGNAKGIPFTPATGHLLLFPSWLEHRVEPFQATDAEQERISIAFNACNPLPRSGS